MKFNKAYIIFTLGTLTFTSVVNGQNMPSMDLDLEDPDDIKLLMDEFNSGSSTQPKALSEDDISLNDTAGDAQSVDDLEQLKTDLGDIEFTLPEEDSELVKAAKRQEELENSNQKIKILTKMDGSKQSRAVFDIGKAEKDLLNLATKMQGKIPDSEWNDIAGLSTSGTYEVVEGDWLWKISEKIFGTGFYYSKIWALNPYITNPHEIEPGMVLSFTTGSDKDLPDLNLEKAKETIAKKTGVKLNEFDKWGDDAKPAWIDERKDLIEQGVYLQYATGDTQADLNAAGSESLIKEFEIYEPPKLDFAITVPDTEFDETGFDKNAKVTFDFKEGFYLNTFLSTNIVQDFGKIESARDEKNVFSDFDTVYVRFDEKLNIVAGDKFSVYAAEGKVNHINSDRVGFKYTVNGSLETIQKHADLWECKIIETVGVMSRGDRLTVYTPKIDRIVRTYNPKIIEAVLIGSYYRGRPLASFGDVIYLDRGRADGVEIGNVFEVYGFKDRGTKKNITNNPTYKNGELTVITVTDNFSTALVTNSVRDFEIGDVAVTKTKEAAARATKLKNQALGIEAQRASSKVLDELDVELNLDDLNDSLLDKADSIQFTEDELAELERQEREKSVITESEKDLRSLERLENELETAEKMLNEARLDEDKLLEDESLDKVEQKMKVQEQESLDEIEENFGKRYLDEDLNDKENPYGLTEFDIEEIDELLNNDQASKK